jgi:hypothetical protein
LKIRVDLEGTNGIEISQQLLKQSKRLLVNTSPDMKIRYKIEGFTLRIRKKANNEVVVFEPAEGDLLTERQKEIISRLGSGDVMEFTDIKIKGSDGAEFYYKKVAPTVK